MMINNVLILKHPRTETVKNAPVGFSWTCLLFGFCVPFSRGDWLNGLLWLIAYLPTFGLSSIPMAFVYNCLYARSLFKKGYILFAVKGTVFQEEMDKILNKKNAQA